MIIVLKKGADKKQVEGLLNWLRERNISPHVSTGERETLIGCVRRLDEANRVLILADGTKIDIDTILELTLMNQAEKRAPGVDRRTGENLQ